MKEEVELNYVIMCLRRVSGLSPRQCLARQKWCPTEFQEKVRKEGIRIVGIKTLEVDLSDPPIYNYKIVWVTSNDRVFSQIYSVRSSYDDDLDL